MDRNNYEKEEKIIKYIARENGYKEKMIDTIIRKKEKKREEPERRENTERKEFICVPFSSTLDKAIRKTFTNTKFKCSYKTRNNAFNMIKSQSQTNQHTNKYTKSGIYKINCSDCNKYYIGQTGRNFQTRFKEHIQALKSNNRTTQKSTFAEHILSANHTYTDMTHNMKILDYEQKGGKLNTKEEFQIYAHSRLDKDNILNISQIDKQNPIYEKIIQYKNRTH
jgi:hypothetical protein